MPMSPEAGTQNMFCSQRGAAELQRLRGPGTLVITAVVFLANRPRMASCTGLMSSPATAPAREGQQRLVAALELVHAPAHRVDTARSGCRCRSAAPAAPGRSGCPAARPSPAGAGSPAPWRGSPCPRGRRPGRAGSGRWRRPRRQQHVVDRAAQRLADRLDLVQRQRLAPGHDLAADRLALEPVGESSGISASAATSLTAPGSPCAPCPASRAAAAAGWTARPAT
jgi:hypothetical protein